MDHKAYQGKNALETRENMRNVQGVLSNTRHSLHNQLDRTDSIEREVLVSVAGSNCGGDSYLPQSREAQTNFNQV
jgi:hypothetical protein